MYRSVFIMSMEVWEENVIESRGGGCMDSMRSLTMRFLSISMQ
jgi:hypothetical protein